MSRVVRSMSGVMAAAILVAAGAVSAQADSGGVRAEGVVLVFEHEFTSTVRYENPAGCVKLPSDAHVLTNLTDTSIRVHGDPLCRMPGITVPPGHGSHLAPASASFSA